MKRPRSLAGQQSPAAQNGVLQSFPRRVFALLVVCFIAIGCAESESELDQGFLDREAHTFFTLYNSAGEKAPQFIPTLDKAPLGAMVLLARSANNTVEPRLCTVTHIAEGIVMTAAHCIYRFLDKVTYVSVVFYDRGGVLSSRRVVAAYVAGAPLHRDIALLKIDDRDLHWDSWSDDFSSFVLSSVLPGEGSFQAAIWSLDPVPFVRQTETGPPELGLAMRAMPRQCTGSRTLPSLSSLAKKPKTWSAVWDRFVSGSAANLNLINIKELVVENFFYFDGCDKLWIEGNSGALITTHPLSDTNVLSPSAVASYVYLWPNDRTNSSTEFEFKGPSGLRKISRKESTSRPLFAAGAIFDPVLFQSEQNPNTTALRFDTP